MRVPGKGDPFPAIIGGYGKPSNEIHLVGQVSIPADTGGYGMQPYGILLVGQAYPRPEGFHNCRLKNSMPAFF